jgi:hypothetical protein
MEDVTFHGRDDGRSNGRDDGRDRKGKTPVRVYITRTYKSYVRDVRSFLIPVQKGSKEIQLIQTQEQLIQDVNQLYPKCNYSYLARSNS